MKFLKKYIVFLLLLILVFSCKPKQVKVSDELVLSSLKELYDKESFFKLRSYFITHEDYLSEKDHLYFSALINNAFNSHEQSNILIDKLFQDHFEELAESEEMALHKAKTFNLYNLCDYDACLEECSLILKDYKSLMDSSKYADFQMQKNVLSALKDSPPLMIVKESDSFIKMSRDRMGLLNITILSDSKEYDFLFDTGTTFSFIARSIAEKLKLIIMEVDLQVEGATGKAVDCDIAVIPEFSMGNIIVKNAVFWVFDDKDLYLEKYRYMPGGAIGYPVIKALEEVQLYSDDSVFIPKTPNEYSLNNLAMDDLDPVIAVVQNNDTLPYYLDTGSAFSFLYMNYYDKYKAAIEDTYEEKVFTYGSLGGVETFTSFLLDSIMLEINGKSAWIHNILLHKEAMFSDVEKVYGNLGQDYIFQFEKFIISTKYSSVLFE
jgi:hypothetical protein